MRATQERRAERAAVACLCAIAGLRLFVLAAAFPLFNNVDEHAHFDLVLRYAEGAVPRGLEGFSPEAARLIELYASPEYFFPEGRPAPPPPWSVPGIEGTAGFRRAAGHWESRVNHDATQPPVYYALAAGWYRLGLALGLRGGDSLYWIRFLDIPLVALLVWLSYALVGRIYRERQDLRLGVPFLLAFLPQSALYSITNDALSPLVGALALYAAVELVRGAPKGLLFCAAAGLAAAAAFLTKVSNVAVLGVLGLVLVIRARASRRDWTRLAAPAFAAAVPVGLWMARNQLLLGDPTGTLIITKLVGWVPKPWSGVWDHPIFTPLGALFFLGETAKSFWRGEIVWHGRRLAAAGPDLLYACSSGLFLAAAGAKLLLRRKTDAGARHAHAMSFLLIGLYLLFLADVSVSYEFGTAWYPFKDYPFLTSGRLIAGCLVPFLVLYVDGLGVLLSRAPGWARWTALALVAAIAAGSEMALAWPVFASPYNWFHLR